jgi:MFS family permease
MALGLLFFVITAGTFSSLGVVLPAMIKDLGWSWTQAGLGFTVLAVVCGLASYAPTLVIRALGVRATLIGGGLIMGAGFLCLYLVRSPTLYLVGAGLEGLGFAMTSVIPGAYVLSHLFRRASAPLGLYFTLGGLGGVFGPWVYFAILRVTQDWRVYWLCLAVASCALAVIAAFSIDPRRMVETEAEPDTAASADAIGCAARDWTARAALATAQFWIIVAAYTMNILVEVTVNGLSVGHLHDRGVSAQVAGGMLSLQALMGVLGRVAGGWIGERTPAKRLVVAGLACTVVGTVALALTRGGPLMVVYAVGVGFGYGLTYLATTVLLLEAFGRRRNLELFSTVCLISTLAAVGPVLAGAVRDVGGGFSPVFWLFAVMTAVAMVAVALMRPLDRPTFTPG